MAIAYDFDGTLAPGNMQEHSFIPDLGVSKEDFWGEAKKMAREQDMDEILAYMHLMLERARHKVPITKDSFRKHGQQITFFPGVPEWFARINAYAKSRGVGLHHFIVSSGLREMVEGSAIGKRFDYIFASGFAYDANDVAIWPALAVNYTTKTQYLFRINKGIENSFDNNQINKFVPEEERPFPFSAMVYLGDGETDVPCMKMIKYQGGYAVAVFDPKKRKTSKRKSGKEVALELLRHQRADYAVSADYREDSDLDTLIKAIIDRVANGARLGMFRGGGAEEQDEAASSLYPGEGRSQPAIMRDTSEASPKVETRRIDELPT